MKFYFWTLDTLLQFLDYMSFDLAHFLKQTVTMMGL